VLAPVRPGSSIATKNFAQIATNFRIIAASHQRGSTLFLLHLFSFVPVSSPELCIANSKIDLFVVHSFGMILLLTSQILRRVYEFTYPRIHEDNPITSEYSARYLVDRLRNSP
jgi:hypothetical protein